MEIDEKLLFWSAFIIGSWYWFDKKLLYIRNQLIISLLLCLMYLVAVAVMHHIYIAPIPLASITGRIIINKYMDKYKMREIDLDAEDEVDGDGVLEERAKMFVYVITTSVVYFTFYVFYLIVKLVFQ